MKKVFILLCLLLLISSCNNKEDNSFKVGYSSNLIDKKDREELKKIFIDNNISNIDVFFNWLDDYNQEKDMGCGLKNWENTEKIEYDEAKCANRYEKNHSISDGDCRITAFALIQDKISIVTKENSYGSYLMFDMDVLENNKEYSNVNDKQLDFINIFNEMDVSNVKKENYKNVFPNKLKDHEFKMNDDKVSLISVVLNDSDFNLLYVGHAGILIKLEDKYLFVEKIAFEQPYQINVIKSKEELSSLFKNRLNYFGDASEEGPYIYENDKLIYEYE